MRPAFASTRQAGAFALLLLVVLLLPVIVRKSWLPSREEAYSAQGWGTGPYPWIQQQLFAETGDLDIAILGSSHILHCLNAVKLQEALGKRLGRPASVRVIAWGGAGYDALYFIAKELFSRRKVKMLVFYDENPSQGGRNTKSPVWFRFQDDAASLDGLPFTEKCYFYFATIVGMPRNLLSLVRPNCPADLHSMTPNYWEEHYRSSNLADNLGSTCSELGFDSRPGADCDPAIPFLPFTPQSKGSAEGASIYSRETESEFHFSNQAIPVWQLQFARKLATLVESHGCKLAMLHIPVLDEARAAKINERCFWPKELISEMAMVGIPPSKMFGAMTDDEIRKLYFNPSHLNKNGQEYFTDLITPALLKIYVSRTNL